MKGKLLRFWQNYNLSIVLGILFIICWTAQFIVLIYDVKAEAALRGGSFDWPTLWLKFWTATLENWQSEFLQLFSFVVLTAFFVHKNSHESKDSEERLERKVDHILHLLSKQETQQRESAYRDKAYKD